MRHSMDNRLCHRLLLLCLVAMCGLVFGTKAGAQANITVQSAVGQSPEAFINNNLIGSGVYISNVHFNG